MLGMVRQIKGVDNRTFPHLAVPHWLFHIVQVWISFEYSNSKNSCYSELHGTTAYDY